MSIIAPMVRPMVRPMVTAMGEGGQRTPAQIIQSLFAQGQQGFWLPFTDFASLSQDSAGTLPYTALEQPVGLILDKSKGGGRGPELSPNGGTFDDAAGWTITQPTSSISGGVLNVGAGACNIFPPIASVVAGKSYEVTFTISNSTANYGIRILNKDIIGTGDYFPAGGQYITANGSYRFVCVAISNGSIGVNRVGGHTGSLQVDNFSVKEIPGNHATQPTSTARGAVSARVNWLVKSEALSVSPWGASGEVVVSDGASCSTLTFGAGQGWVTQGVAGFPPASNLGATFTLKLIANTASRVLFWGGASAAGTDVVSITPLGGGEWLQTVSRTFTSVSGGNPQFQINNSVVGNGAVVIVRACSFVFPQQAALPYQRVTTPTDYDSVGFPKYLRLDGADDFYTCGGGGSTTGFYYSDVITHQKPPGSNMVLFSDLVGNSGYEILLNSTNGLIGFKVGNGSIIGSLNSDEPLTLGAAAHVACYFDGTNATVTINGVAKTKVLSPVAAGSSTITLYRSSSSSNYFGGQITEPIYRVGPPPSAYEREVIRAYQMQKAGL